MAAVDKKGRTKKAGRFVALPHRVLISRAYGSLDCVTRQLLLGLCMIYNGSNNGSLWLSVRDAMDRLGLSDHHAVTRAFEDLEDRRFIQLTKEAHFSVKASSTSRARCWRVSWLVWQEGPKSRRAPDWSFEQWQMPEGTDKKSAKARKRAEQRAEAIKRWRKAQSENRLPVVDFTTTTLERQDSRPSPVVDFTTAILRNGGKQPISVVGDSTTHIDSTMGRESRWADALNAHLSDTKRALAG